MNVHIRQTAREDILEAALFYDDQEEGLGVEVMAFLDQKIRDLAMYAGIHPVIRGFHRATLRGQFPYFRVYYTMEADGMWVRAVLDHRRDPRTLHRRLREV